MGKSGGDLGKTSHDDGDGERRQQDGCDTRAAHQAGQNRRQAEDSTSNDAIHDQGRKRPPAHCTNQSFAGSALFEVFLHGAFVSQIFALLGVAVTATIRQSKWRKLAAWKNEDKLKA